jgi:hypothetical protein
MTVSGVSGVLPSNVSSTVNQMASLLTAVGEDGVKVTLSASAADAVNLKQDMISLKISEEALKAEMQAEQSVAVMLQKSVDMWI